MENEVKAKQNRKMSVSDLTRVALFAALIAVSAWISISVPPISFTLQIFAVYMALFLLGGKYGVLAILLYLIIGAVGVPVFSGFRGGVGVLLGVTGGYLVGFLVAGLVFAAVTARGRVTPLFQTVGVVLSLLSCYAFGTAWYMVLYLTSSGPVALGSVLMACVVPFLLPDAVKIALAYLVSAALKKRIRR